MAQAEGREGVHRSRRQRRRPGAAAAQQNKPDGEPAEHERAEDEKVVARDGVVHPGDLEGRSQDMVGQRQSAAGGEEIVGVPKVREPAADLMHDPLEEV